jgi:hypothetical protein
MNYCPECGEEINGEVTYCPSCGSNVGDILSTENDKTTTSGGQQQTVAADGESTLSQDTDTNPEEPDADATARSRVGKLLALLTVIGCGVMIIDGISSAGVTTSRQGSFHLFKWVLVVPPMATGIGSLIVSYGHWFRRRWSWRITQIVYGIYGMTVVAALVYSGPINPTGVTLLGAVLTLVVFYFVRAYDDAYTDPVTRTAG